MAIEIALTGKITDPEIRNVTLFNNGQTLTLPRFEELILLGSDDIQTLCNLPTERVTLLRQNVGEVSVSAGIYILEGGATVHAEVQHGASVKFRQFSVYLTISAPSMMAFMDAYAMAINNKLRGLELQPKNTDTFRQVAQTRAN